MFYSNFWPKLPQALMVKFLGCHVHIMFFCQMLLCFGGADHWRNLNKNADLAAGEGALAKHKLYRFELYGQRCEEGV